MGRKVVAKVPAEILFGPSVGRPVVVGEVEVGDAAVEGSAQDGPLGLLRMVGAEVLPKAEREGRQLEAASSTEAVVHVGVVAIGRGGIGHGDIIPSSRPDGGRTSELPRSSGAVPS